MTYGEDEISRLETGPIGHTARFDTVQVLKSWHSIMQRFQVLHACHGFGTAQHETESTLTLV